METEQYAHAMADFEAILGAERGRLVGLCAHLSGSTDAAEDLAQEACVEAWRNRHKLHDASGADRWLSAIARHVCARWTRSRSRDLRRLAAQTDSDERRLPADGLDLEVELERDELAHLLDRAMAHLPAETRVALVARYVEGLPQAQVAMRLGLSEGAVAMRLRRGKLALRRLLATDLHDEATAYGLAGGDDGRWEDARIWCPVCGRHHLWARLLCATGELTLRCPGCTPASDGYISRATMPLLHRDSTTARVGVSRLLDWMHHSYYGIAPGGMVRCQRCGRPTPPLIVVAGWDCVPQVRYTVETACAACGHRDRMWLSGLALALPEGRQFWREHRRVRLLPEQTVERDGRDVAIVGLAGVETGARLEVVTDLQTLTVCEIHTGLRHTSEALPQSR